MQKILPISILGGFFLRWVYSLYTVSPVPEHTPQDRKLQTVRCGDNTCDDTEDCGSCPHDCSAPQITASYHLSSCTQGIDYYDFYRGFEVGVRNFDYEAYGFSSEVEAFYGVPSTFINIGLSGIRVGAVVTCSNIPLSRMKNYVILNNRQVIVIEETPDIRGNNHQTITAIFDPDGQVIETCPVAPSASPLPTCEMKFCIYNGQEVGRLTETEETCVYVEPLREDCQMVLDDGKCSYWCEDTRIGYDEYSYLLQQNCGEKSFEPTIRVVSCSSTISASITPSVTSTSSRTRSVALSVTPSRTSSITPSSTITRTPSATSSITPTRSPSGTPSVTPSGTPTTSPTRTATSSVTPTPTQTITSTNTMSATQTALPVCTKNVCKYIENKYGKDATDSWISMGHVSIIVDNNNQCSYYIQSGIVCQYNCYDNGPEGGSTCMYDCDCPVYTQGNNPYSPADCRFSESSTTEVIPCSVSMTPSTSNTPSLTATRTPSPTATASSTPSLSSTPTSSMTATGSSSVAPSHTSSTTPSITPTGTGSITSSHTPTPTPSHTPSMTPTSSITPSATQTVTTSPSKSITPSTTNTLSSSASWSSSVSASSSSSSSAASSSSALVSSSSSSSGSASISFTTSPAVSVYYGVTQTVTASPTTSPTASPTASPSTSPTVSNTIQISSSNTPTHTTTIIVQQPSQTPTITPSPTPSSRISVTPSVMVTSNITNTTQSSEGGQNPREGISSVNNAQQSTRTGAFIKSPSGIGTIVTAAVVITALGGIGVAVYNGYAAKWLKPHQTTTPNILTKVNPVASTNVSQFNTYRSAQNSVKAAKSPLTDTSVQIHTDKQSPLKITRQGDSNPLFQQPSQRELTTFEVTNVRKMRV